MNPSIRSAARFSATLPARLAAPTLVAALALGLGSAASEASAQPAHRIASIEVLDLVRLNAHARPGAPRLRELSGLAWDADEGQLIAVSDKGAVFSMTLDVELGRIESVVISAAAKLNSETRVNAESVWVRNGDNGRQGDSEILIVDEAAGEIVIVDLQGLIRSRLGLPEALRDSSKYEKKNRGVEALAWYPRHGAVAAPQRPLTAHLPGTHRIYAGDGSVWAFTADRRGPSSVKAIERLGDASLLVLEKVRTPTGDASILREVTLAVCGEHRPCNPPTLALHGSGIDSSHNFEGLACISRDLCLLVTDDGKIGSAPGSLALVRLDYR
jgi:hypothetical protein